MQNPFGTAVTFRSAASPDELTIDDIADLIRNGRLRANDSLTHAGAADWKPAGQFPELQAFFAARVAPSLQPRPRPPVVIDRRGFLGLILPGIVLLAWTAPPVWIGVAHSRWQHTFATITEAGGRGDQRYLRYSYVVEGIEYTGIDPGGVSEVGNHLHIYYDPAHPAVSSRIYGISWETCGVALGGITLIGLGLFSFLKPESRLAEWVARHLSGD
jgi:hypothetical protein